VRTSWPDISQVEKAKRGLSRPWPYVDDNDTLNAIANMLGTDLPQTAKVVGTIRLVSSDVLRLTSPDEALRIAADAMPASPSDDDVRAVCDKVFDHFRAKAPRFPVSSLIRDGRALK
jgi:hypothetical protein